MRQVCLNDVRWKMGWLIPRIISVFATCYFLHLHVRSDPQGKRQRASQILSSCSDYLCCVDSLANLMIKETPQHNNRWTRSTWYSRSYTSICFPWKPPHPTGRAMWNVVPGRTEITEACRNN
ncbi:hypothetical protein MLD38_027145 [Melastoma candidum]|uniref:Uncharacterized protein n=1 Tax=Melastoma candidum TaxID=119954 RepID=A0ACB9P0L9_9MYRT|nr:hypothetical protein MLD38_027145 [Melastoma candidum]